MTQVRTVTATFTAPSFPLTVLGAGTGTGSVTSQVGLTPAINCTVTSGTASGACTATYLSGTSVVLTATATAPATFASWTNCPSPSGNQCTVPMTQVRTVTATFTAPSFPLTVLGAGTGTGSVTSQVGLTPAINCAVTSGTASGACTATYLSTTSVVLTATATAPATFASWTNCPSPSGNQCTVSMTQARTVTATFQLPSFLLSMQSAGTGTGTGTITSHVGLTPAINCLVTSGNYSGVCSAAYLAGTPVVLTATPTAPSTFTAWANCPSPSGNQCTVAMTQARTVTATFTAAPPTLTVTGGGTGSGTVTSPAGLTPAITCAVTSGTASGACSATYPPTTSAVLTATPTAPSTFASWTNCPSPSGNQCTVPMTQARTVTANFVLLSPTITSITPASGPVTGGTLFSVAATGLAPNVTLLIGGVPATSVTVVNAITLTGVTPAGMSGAQDVTLSTANSTSTLPGGFTYDPARRSEELADTLEPSLNGDGRYLAFASFRNDLVPNDVNETADVFVREVVSAAVVRVSVNTTGTAGNGESRRPSISGDGRYVAFESQASTLVPDDTNGVADIFVHDRDADGDGVFDEAGQVRTLRVSVATETGAQGDGASTTPEVSPDGLWVTFASAATNLVSGDTAGQDDIFLRFWPGRETRRVSVSSSGEQGNGASRAPSVSAAGRYVVFASEASNLRVPDSNGVSDVFRHETATGVTICVTAQGNGASETPSISADGQWVAHASRASNLPTSLTAGLLTPRGLATAHEDGSGRAQVLMWGAQTGTSTTESATASGEPGNGDSSHPKLSDDGKTVAFVSEASNLVGGDTNGVADSFKKEARRGAPERTSVGPDNQQLPRPTTNTAIAGNGRAVASEVRASASEPERRAIIVRAPTLVLRQMTQAVGFVDRATAAAIDGMGIAEGAQVVIDDVAVAARDVERESDQRLRLIVPPGKAVGSVTVVVVNPDGERITVPGGFTYVSAPSQEPTADADGDGLIDGWEQQLGLQVTSAAGVQGGSGDPDGDGRTNLEEQAALTHPRGLASATRYFAEGATGFFETRFSLLNPTTTDATVLLRFQRDDGTQRVNVRPGARPAESKGRGQRRRADMASTAFSTVIEADQPIVADRQMYWTRLNYLRQPRRDRRSSPRPGPGISPKGRPTPASTSSIWSRTRTRCRSTCASAICCPRERRSRRPIRSRPPAG